MAGEAAGREIVGIAAGPIADRAPRPARIALAISAPAAPARRRSGEWRRWCGTRRCRGPTAKPMVATNRPMTVKESARPTASARGPSRCALAAVPSTSGKSGRHAGRKDREDAGEERKPEGRERHRGALERACRARRRSRPGWYRRPCGPSRSRRYRRSACFARCALSARTSAFCSSKSTLNTTCCEFRLAGELGEDRVLRPADRAPHGKNIDQDRLAVLLGLGEGGGVEGLPLGRRSRERAEQRDRSDDGKEKRADRGHLSILPADPCRFAHELKAAIAARAIAARQSRSLEVLRELAPPGRAIGGERARKAETTAFQPAKDSPRKRQEASSQRMIGVSTMPPSPHCSSNAPEHSLGPGHHFHSTPAW